MAPELPEPALPSAPLPALEPPPLRSSMWRRLWRRPRHRLAAAVLGGFLVIALFADVLASDLPLALSLGGHIHLLPCLTHPSAMRGQTQASLAAQGAVGMWRTPVPYGPEQTDLSSPPLSPPSRQHLLGTDRVGRDVLARLIHGTRVSLAVGFLATALAGLLGLSIGALAGFLGSWSDAVLSRGMEVVQTFPVLFLVVGVMALWPGAGVGVLILVLGLTRWIEMGRLARAEALRVRGMPYVLAARALGASEGRIFGVHVLPAAAGPVLVSASLAAGSMILAESALTFLGFGVPAPTASWGELLGEARSVPSAWWLAAAPGTCIFLVVAACNVLGEGLRDALSGREGDERPTA